MCGLGLSRSVSYIEILQLSPFSELVNYLIRPVPPFSIIKILSGTMDIRLFVFV